MQFVILVEYCRTLWAVIGDSDDWGITDYIEDGEAFNVYGLGAVIMAFNKGEIPHDKGTDIILRPI